MKIHDIILAEGKKIRKLEDFASWRPHGIQMPKDLPKSEFVSKLINQIKNLVDTEVDRQMDYAALEAALNDESNAVLLGLNNVLSYHDDFTDSWFDWGNFQEVLLQASVRYRHRNQIGNMYEQNSNTRKVK